MTQLFSTISNVSFLAPRPCRPVWFEAVDDAPKRGWLRADVSIECNTPEHEYVKLLAWVAVLVYPIGMWLGCFALLRKASTTIFSGKSTPFSRSVSFLYACYRVPAFWWELMEMLRKFLLIGLFVTVEPGTILQIFIGTVVSGAYFVRIRLLDGLPRATAVRALALRISREQMIQMKAQPYLSQAECVAASTPSPRPSSSRRASLIDSHPCSDLLAQAASWCLLMLFFSCVIYKYDSLTASDDLQDKMSSEQVGFAQAAHGHAWPLLTVFALLAEGQLHCFGLGAHSAPRPQRLHRPPLRGWCHHCADGCGGQKRCKAAPAQVRRDGP
jgi:hypothetical protein